MRTKRIHINKHTLARNRKKGCNEPPVTVKTYNSNIYGHTVEIKGPSRVIHSPRPLSCGARVWVETEAPVLIDDHILIE